jgi:hypothetical protein
MLSFSTRFKSCFLSSMRQGPEAAAEFQKILDHSGIVWNCWTGALAHLGVARANALQARNSQGADADLAREPRACRLQCSFAYSALACFIPEALKSEIL